VIAGMALLISTRSTPNATSPDHRGCWFSAASYSRRLPDATATFAHMPEISYDSATRRWQKGERGHTEVRPLRRSAMKLISPTDSILVASAAIGWPIFGPWRPIQV
jgi:hypothetical protein